MFVIFVLVSDDSFFRFVDALLSSGKASTSFFFIKNGFCSNLNSFYFNWNFTKLYVYIQTVSVYVVSTYSTYFA